MQYHKTLPIENHNLLIRYLPAFAWVSYHVIVLLLNFYGPLYWDVVNPTRLVLFLAAANLMFLIGYTSGEFVHPKTASISPENVFFKLGAILTILLLLPNMAIYAGKGFGDIGGAIADQGVAWQHTQEQIVIGSGSRTPFALLRAILAPFTLSVAPLIFLLWTTLKWRWKIIGILAIISIITFSIARGTDKETIELGLFTVFGVFAFLVRNPESIFRRKKLVISGFLIALIVITAALTLFIERKNARLGDVVVYCQSITKECADYDHPVLSWMNEENRGSGAIVVNYLTQGLYGLSQALDEPFESTYGLGHSAFVIAQANRFSGAEDFFERSYTFKLDAAGWPRKYSWSTAYTWIANDIGFFGTIILMAIWGFILATAWRDFLYANNMLSYLVVVCFVFTLFYIPMNFQIPQTIDYYIPAIIWFLAWLFSRTSIRS